MKVKMRILFIILSVGIVPFLSLQGALPDPDPEPPPPPPPMAYSPFEQHPPIAKHMWVQKLVTPLEDSSNVIMRVEYEDTSLPDSITMYYGGDFWTFTLRDNGVFPDLVADDNIYSTYLQENIPLFISKLSATEAALTTKGFTLKFTGHSGQLVTDIPFFDEASFNNFEETELDPLVVAPADCDEEILKQNSLFVTDISVIEDGARTYQPQPSGSGMGTPLGAWTFGYMIREMANTSASGITAKDLLKSWLENYTDNITVNQQLVYKRTGIYEYVLGPWIKRCDPSINVNSFSIGYWEANWEAIWDSIPEADILRYAPFRLTAIVNRLDLRGNSAFWIKVENAGETRFIFTLIPPVGKFAGQTPIHNNSDFNNRNSFDWMGMNIILEYGNPQEKLCDLKAFGQQWLDLSDLALGSSTYNDALEVITRTVTDAGQDPAKPNGSCINRIRTNERILESPGAKTPTVWAKSDWEFRQFELNTSGLFEQVPLTNTPLNSANFSENLQANIGSGPPRLPAYNSSEGAKLMDFIYDNLASKLLVRRGTHELPATYPDGTPLLAAVGNVYGEYAHYFGLDFGTSTTKFDANQYQNDTTYFNQSNRMRHMLSLNTCQGCHNGETKVNFMQVVSTLPYGQQNNYWDQLISGSNPHYSDQLRIDSLDTRFAFNDGDNLVNNPSVAEDNFAIPTGTKAYPFVSSFITGRKVVQLNGAGQMATYGDDLDEFIDNQKDPIMRGLYYVFDPTNRTTPISYYAPTALKNGFNDLEMRKKSLCELVNMVCEPTIVPYPDLIENHPILIEINWAVFDYVFPTGSH